MNEVPNSPQPDTSQVTRAPNQPHRREILRVLPHQDGHSTNTSNQSPAQTKTKHLALMLNSFNYLRVPLVTEADTGVLRFPTKDREMVVDSFLDRLAQLVQRRFDARAHFEIILLR